MAGIGRWRGVVGGPDGGRRPARGGHRGRADQRPPRARLAAGQDRGLPRLGGAKVRLVVVDHRGKPAVGQAEAERRYGMLFLSGESSSPSFHRRGLKLGAPIITQYRGGACRAVWRFDLASSDVLYPLPKWSERP